MNKRHFFLSVGALVALGSSTLFLTGCGGTSEAHDHGDDTTLKEGSEATNQQWTCPMHPQIQRSGPSNCPLCGMALVQQKSTGSSTNEFQQTLSAEARSLAFIHSTPVRRAPATVEISAYGEIRYDQTRMRTLAARFPARVERLFVNFEGMRVQKGDHLATVYSPDLLAAKRELLTAARQGTETALFTAARRKLELWDIGEDQIESILEKQEADPYLEIRSPLSGVITTQNITEGNYVDTGSPLFQVAETERLWVDLALYEKDAKLVRFGQDVRFASPSAPGREFTGRVNFIAPEISPATRTLTVRAYLENDQGLLRPGANVRARITTQLNRQGQVIAPDLEGKWISPMHPEIIKDAPGKCDVCGMALVQADELGYTPSHGRSREALLIPASAALVTGERAIVFLEAGEQDGDVIYEIRQVALGPRIGEEYMVYGGLDEGDVVVSQGAFRLDSAAQLVNRPSMLNPVTLSEPTIPVEQSEDYGQFNQITRPVIANYLTLQNYLARDNLAGASQSATALLDEMNGLPTEIPVEMRSLLDTIAHQLHLVAHAEEIEDARGKNLETLDTAITNLLVAFGTDPELAVYRMHCPMVYGSTGADWLQADDELLNPYFGAYMLTCGEGKGKWDHEAREWKENS